MSEREPFAAGIIGTTVEKGALAFKTWRCVCERTGKKATIVGNMSHENAGPVVCVSLD